ncbi:hypothetical protein GCM10009826_37050 [Humibacillus xanthopallidus]
MVTAAVPASVDATKVTGAWRRGQSRVLRLSWSYELVTVAKERLGGGHQTDPRARFPELMPLLQLDQAAPDGAGRCPRAPWVHTDRLSLAPPGDLDPGLDGPVDPYLGAPVRAGGGLLCRVADPR